MGCNERVMHTKVTDESVGYDVNNDMFKVSSMQKKFRDSFGGAVLDSNKWVSTIGTGGTVSVSGGQLTIGSGTTINAETSVLSKEVFSIPFKLSLGLVLSQRIANQTFYVEAVSVDPTTGNPDGKHCASLLFDGTTVTQAKYRVQSSSITPLDSSASTFPTTASGSFYEVEPFGDEVWFHGGTLDSTTGRANSYRRHQQIPDPNAFYKIRLRWLNGGVAPATNTNAVIQYVACQDYAELTAEITSGRGNGVAGQGIYATVGGSVTVTANTPVSTTTHTLTCVATTNATSVKTTGGNIYNIVVTNLSASPRYLKLYNKASAPTVGTDVPVATIPIPATSCQVFEFGALGLRLATGIAFAVTANAIDTDTTAIAINEIKTMIAYV